MWPFLALCGLVGLRGEDDTKLNPAINPPNMP